MTTQTKAGPGIEQAESVPSAEQTATAAAMPATDAVARDEVVAQPAASTRHGSGTSSNTGPATSATRRGGRWFSACCALVALAAAGTALAAPWLRPRMGTEARNWLGADNVVSRMLAPEPGAAEAPASVLGTPLPPAPAAAPLPAVATTISPDREPTRSDRPARIESVALAQSLAAYDQRIQAIAAALDTMRGDLVRGAEARAGVVNDLSRRTDGLSLRADVLTRHADQMQSSATVLEARARAGNVLALAIALRRDVDAGVPIGRDCSALEAAGAFPAPVKAALRELMRLDAGIPTMRDLAEAFEAVQTRLTAGTEGSAIGRGWSWAWSAFVTAPRSTDDNVLEHLRALAAEARFSEAAGVLETSRWAPLGAAWVAMVRARAAGVVATQVILVHALRGSEAAYAVNGGEAAMVPPK